MIGLSDSDVGLDLSLGRALQQTMIQHGGVPAQLVTVPQSIGPW